MLSLEEKTVVNTVPDPMMATLVEREPEQTNQPVESLSKNTVDKSDDKPVFF
jgi:hypothetical protein